MSLAFGKNLARAPYGSVRDQYPQPRRGSFGSVVDQHDLPVQRPHAQPLQPIARPIYNGPMGAHGPNGFGGPVSLQPGDGVGNVRATGRVHGAGAPFGGATGLVIRNNSVLRRTAPRPFVYGGLRGAYGKTSDAEWAEMGLGHGGGSASSASSGGGGANTGKVLDFLGKALDVFSGSKRPSDSTYVPVPPPQTYTPPPASSMPSWGVPVLAVTALGLVGAAVYSFVR